MVRRTAVAGRLRGLLRGDTLPPPADGADRLATEWLHGAGPRRGHGPGGVHRRAPAPGAPRAGRGGHRPARRAGAYHAPGPLSRRAVMRATLMARSAFVLAMLVLGWRVIHVNAVVYEDANRPALRIPAQEPARADALRDALRANPAEVSALVA